MVQLRVTWTPYGPMVERLEDGRVVAAATYGTIDQALDGMRIAMTTLERDYSFLA